jgi:hypothetical protein
MDLDDSGTGGSAAAGWVPDVCTLPNAERPLRIAEFDVLFAGAVRSAERIGQTRLRLELAPGAGVAGRAAELMAAETSCCSFFTFTLTAAGGALALEIGVPAPHAGVLEALARRAGVAGSAA